MGSGVGLLGQSMACFQIVWHFPWGRKPFEFFDSDLVTCSLLHQQTMRFKPSPTHCITEGYKESRSTRSYHGPSIALSDGWPYAVAWQLSSTIEVFVPFALAIATQLVEKHHMGFGAPRIPTSKCSREDWVDSIEVLWLGWISNLKKKISFFRRASWFFSSREL